MNHVSRGPDTPTDVRVESTLSCWMVSNALARSKKTTTLLPPSSMVMCGDFPVGWNYARGERRVEQSSKVVRDGGAAEF